MSADGLHPFPHAEQPQPFAVPPGHRRFHIKRYAVVMDAQADGCLDFLKADLNQGGLGVLVNIRERCLHDPVNHCAPGAAQLLDPGQGRETDADLRAFGKLVQMDTEGGDQSLAVHHG